MEHQKILHLLNKANDSKFVTRKWNIFNDQSNADYGVGNEITYSTEVLKSNLCDYNDAYILVTGDIAIIGHQETQVAFKSCAPFSKYITKTDEATNFNADIANTNNFKSFKYKAKLLGKNEADGANGILRNATIAVPLKHLSNFWRSCKVELKFKWTKYCVLSAAGADNNNGNDNISFTTKGTKLYVPLVTLSAKDNQKLTKLLSKGFERSIYWNEYKTKNENKNTTNEYRYFNRLFVSL